jgi:hypothetical protein
MYIQRECPDNALRKWSGECITEAGPHIRIPAEKNSMCRRMREDFFRAFDDSFYVLIDVIVHVPLKSSLRPPALGGSLRRITRQFFVFLQFAEEDGEKARTLSIDSDDGISLVLV